MRWVQGVYVRGVRREIKIVIYHIVSILYLYLNSLSDIRYKKISIWLSLVFGGVGVIINLIFKQYSVQSIILAISIGALVVFLSKITRGAIGLGDGIVIMVLGVYTGVTNNLSAVLYGFLISAILAIVLLGLKRVKRKDSLPFVPCLFIGYLITLAL